MNAREFFTKALLSSHQVLVRPMPDDLLPHDDQMQLANEIMPIAEMAAQAAALYATQLTEQWRSCMEFHEECDKDPAYLSSTQNLTKPPLEVAKT